jgi:hypothetical protein
MPGVSERRVCDRLSVPRSAVRERTPRLRRPVVDELLAARLQCLITLHPTFGYRRLWALLRFQEGLPIHRKAVYRALRLQAGSCISGRRRHARASTGGEVERRGATNAGRWT